MSNKNTTREDKEKQQVAKEILETIESVDYGEVIIAIHDSRVVQIEKREKKRFR
jgi:hypothetical protein